MPFAHNLGQSLRWERLSDVKYKRAVDLYYQLPFCIFWSSLCWYLVISRQQLFYDHPCFDHQIQTYSDLYL